MENLKIETGNEIVDRNADLKTDWKCITGKNSRVRRFIEEIKEERDKFYKMCRFKEVVFWIGMLCSAANLVLLVVNLLR